MHDFASTASNRMICIVLTVAFAGCGPYIIPPSAQHEVQRPFYGCQDRGGKKESKLKNNMIYFDMAVKSVALPPAMVRWFEKVMAPGEGLVVTAGLKFLQHNSGVAPNTRSIELSEKMVGLIFDGRMRSRVVFPEPLVNEFVYQFGDLRLEMSVYKTDSVLTKFLKTVVSDILEADWLQTVAGGFLAKEFLGYLGSAIKEQLVKKDEEADDHGDRILGPIAMTFFPAEAGRSRGTVIGVGDYFLIAHYDAAQELPMGLFDEPGLKTLKEAGIDDTAKRELLTDPLSIISDNCPAEGWQKGFCFFVQNERLFVRYGGKNGTQAKFLASQLFMVFHVTVDTRVRGGTLVSILAPLIEETTKLQEKVSRLDCAVLSDAATSNRQTPNLGTAPAIGTAAAPAKKIPDVRKLSDTDVLAAIGLKELPNPLRMSPLEFWAALKKGKAMTAAKLAENLDMKQGRVATIVGGIGAFLAGRKPKLPKDADSLNKYVDDMATVLGGMLQGQATRQGQVAERSQASNSFLDLLPRTPTRMGSTIPMVTNYEKQMLLAIGLNFLRLQTVADELIGYCGRPTVPQFNKLYGIANFAFASWVASIDDLTFIAANDDTACGKPFLKEDEAQEMERIASVLLEKLFFIKTGMVLSWRQIITTDFKQLAGFSKCDRLFFSCTARAIRKTSELARTGAVFEKNEDPDCVAWPTSGCIMGRSQ